MQPFEGEKKMANLLAAKYHGETLIKDFKTLSHSSFVTIYDRSTVENLKTKLDFRYHQLSEQKKSIFLGAILSLVLMIIFAMIPFVVAGPKFLWFIALIWAGGTLCCNKKYRMYKIDMDDYEDLIENIVDLLVVLEELYLANIDGTMEELLEDIENEIPGMELMEETAHKSDLEQVETRTGYDDTPTDSCECD